MSTNMKHLYICEQIDSNYFVNCHKVIKYSILQGLTKCKLNLKAECTSEEILDMKLSLGLSAPSNTLDECHLKCKNDSNLSIRQSLQNWIDTLNEPNYSWQNFTTVYDPINRNDPKINISIPMFKGRPNFSHMNTHIVSVSGELLFEGVIIKGHLNGQVDRNLADHPGWKTKLTLRFFSFSSMIRDLYMIGTLRNGSFHGRVQMFGILTNDPNDICADSVFPGLSQIGWYENGKPTGPFWRQLVGGNWLYGLVNENGEYSGEEDIAYLYNDLTLAMIGKFKKGLMVYGLPFYLFSLVTIK